ICDDNEANAAVRGLTGHFSDWLYEEETTIYDAIDRRLEETKIHAKAMGIEEKLEPLNRVLMDGNEASKKIELFHDGMKLEDIMEQWVEECHLEDIKIAERFLVN
ncbi:MAG TPA: hypothetical protein V6C96_04820, partial [Vampirovibrionales bacterium]